MSKAARTRARIQAEALALFARQGFDRTTVDQIAAAAGVSQMTFFRHFPTKESAVVDDPFDPQIAAAVAAQPAGLPPVPRVCRGFRTALQHLDLPEQEQVRARVRVASGSPALQAAMWANTLQSQRVVAAVLEQDGVPGPDARAAAGAVIGGLTVALLEWGVSDDPQPLGARLVRVLDLIDPEGVS